MYINLWINLQIKLYRKCIFKQMYVRTHLSYEKFIFMLADWISNVHVHSSNQGHEFLTRSYNVQPWQGGTLSLRLLPVLYYFCISWKRIWNEKMYSELRKRRKILESEIFAGNTELIFEMSTTIELHWIEFQTFHFESFFNAEKKIKS